MADELNNPDQGTQETVSTEDAMLGLLESGDNATTEGSIATDGQEAGSTEAEPEKSEAEEVETEDTPPEVEAEAEGSEDEVFFQIPAKDSDEVLEVSQDELIDGYFRQSDYTKKTQELAAEKQSIAQEKQALAAERQQYASILESQKGTLQANLEKFKEVDWEQLKHDDPDQYLMKRQEFHDLRAEATDMERQQQELAQKQQQDYVEALTEFAQAEDTKLVGKIPGWDTPETKTKLQTQLAEYATKSGFDQQELTHFLDSRAMLLLHKAMMFDESQSKTETVVKKKVQKAVKRVVKPGKQKEPVQADSERRKKLIQAQRQRGDASSTEAALFELFNNE